MVNFIFQPTLFGMYTIPVNPPVALDLAGINKYSYDVHTRILTIGSRKIYGVSRGILLDFVKAINGYMKEIGKPVTPIEMRVRDLEECATVEERIERARTLDLVASMCDVLST